MGFDIIEINLVKLQSCMIYSVYDDNKSFLTRLISIMSKPVSIVVVVIVVVVQIFGPKNLRQKNFHPKNFVSQKILDPKRFWN